MKSGVRFVNGVEEEFDVVIMVMGYISNVYEWFKVWINGDFFLFCVNLFWFILCCLD